jgi:poly-gamma-glutamate capsule biosynthesis protein CapA/YwtB (metallophosphatase superfamily)
MKKTAISEEIREIMSNCDLNVINLESPVAEDAYKPIDKVGPCMKTSVYTISYLKQCGFNAVTLANNHFFDYGENGVHLTIGELKKNDIDIVGGGSNKDDLRKILYKKIGDEIVAILNYCESEFSVGEDIGSNPLDPIHAFYDINEAKSITKNIVVIIHGGHEGYQLPSPRMQKSYRYFIDLGASVVINHHQHCYSGYEKYKCGYIFYGLGNFFFDSSTENDNGVWNYGYFITLYLKDGICNKFKMYPYSQCLDEASVKLLDEKNNAIFCKKIEELNTIITTPSELDIAFNSYCFGKKKNYLSIFTPYNNRYLRYLSKRKIIPSFLSKKKRLNLFDIISCEAHRDIVLKSLLNK